MKNQGLQKTALVAGAGLALVLGACGDDSVVTVTETSTRSVEVTVPPGEPEPTAPTAPTEPTGPTEQPEQPDDPGEVTVPGEQVETYYSREGAVVGVAGLDAAMAPEIIRAQPSSGADPVSRVWRTGSVELAGREWNNTTLPDEGYWVEVRHDGVTGWMPGTHLFYFGGVDDVTGEYADLAPADDPYLLLGRIGERSAAGMGRWAVVTTPEDTGDGAYRVDVTGMPDDAQGGERLRVVVEQRDGVSRLGQVERTPLCHRGVSDGLCL
jgi:hypothetical protein